MMKKDDATKIETRSSSRETAARALLAWYDENGRTLPWRQDPSPYHVWLSEIMSQQTRIETVIPYYQRFLAALPDIPSLAEASEDTCLKLWEGLGYYSRVRNLRKVAQRVMTVYGGVLPKTEDELLTLPGIGPYTAAAIASMTGGQRTPAVDGNLIRIFCRMTWYDQPPRIPAALRAAKAWFLERMPADRPGDFNQALMDLGAGVCLPNSTPLCWSCPWAGACRAHRRGQEMDLPRRPEKKARPVEDRTVLVIRYERGVVLRKRPARGLLAGLYEFPNEDGVLDEAGALAAAKGLGFSPLRIRALPPARHIFTHREWRMTGWEILADEWKPFPEDLILARPEDLQSTYALPAAFSAYRPDTAWAD